MNQPSYKQAGIYIRVSSEKQAEKVSPQAQEADCRAYCEAHGYPVVEVYHDTERYRAGGKMVEPSGTRSDRPQLRRMLADAAAGRFNVIVAWREDRLYRGIRPMLPVIDCIEEHKIEIELVKETFDSKMAPIKASIARMELDARSDRVKMGIAGRLASGKVWSTSLPYGYRQQNGIAEIEPTEADWVKRIWEWKADGVTNQEIRRRLLEGEAPQRSAEGIPWQLPWILQITRQTVYTTGIQLMDWDDKTYEIHFPVIIDPETARRVFERKEKSKAHPARNLKYNYLGLGVVYCGPCNKKMSSFTSHVRKNGKVYPRLVRDYRCGNFLAGYEKPGCPHRISVKRLDAALWEKVWILLTDTETFEEGIRSRIEEIRSQELDAGGEIDRLQKELDNITLERQWVITQARKRSITQEDMEYQLAGLTIQENMTKRALADKSLLVGNRAERLIEFANQFRAALREGLDFLNEAPRTPEEEDYQFQKRREIVEMIVKRVDVQPDKSIKVTFEFDVLPSGIEDSETSPW